jgi:hypothetical protein
MGEEDGNCGLGFVRGPELLLAEAMRPPEGKHCSLGNPKKVTGCIVGASRDAKMIGITASAAWGQVDLVELNQPRHGRKELNTFIIILNNLEAR